MLKLFTMLLDYRGGTYIAQTRAADPTEAISRWCGQLSEENLAEWKLTPDDVALLSQDVPIALDSLRNAWCTSASSTEGYLMLLNIIGTDQAL